MDAYKAAIDDGADGFECDVRITKDNQLVLWHDADMQRVAGHSAQIANSTFSEIKGLYPQAITLEDLLELALLCQPLQHCRLFAAGNLKSLPVVQVLRPSQ